MRLLRATVLGAVVATGACDILIPSSERSGPDAVVLLHADPGLMSVDAKDGSVLAVVPHDEFNGRVAYAWNEAVRRLVLSVSSEELVELSTPGLEIGHRASVGELAVRVEPPLGPLTFRWVTALTWGPDNQSLLHWTVKAPVTVHDPEPDPGHRIARTDAWGGRIHAVSEGFGSGSRAPYVLEPGPSYPNGAVVLLGSRPGADVYTELRSWLYTLDAQSLATVDSVRVDGHGAVWWGVSAEDGENVILFLLNGRVLKVRVRDGAVVAENVARFLWNEVVVDPGNGHLYVTSRFNLNAPPEGLVHVYDRDLELVRVIDVSETVSYDGRAPSLRPFVGLDGDLFLVAGGAFSSSPGSQLPPRLLHVEAGSSEVRVITEFDTGQPLPVAVIPR